MDLPEDGLSTPEPPGTGFHPPAVVALACIFLGAGVLIGVVGTRAIRLPGIQVPLGYQLAKGLLGLMVAMIGVGLYRIRLWALPAAELSLLTVAALSTFSWHGNRLGLELFDKLARFVDWEFAYTLRGMTFLTALILVVYLRRPSVRWAFRHGGVPARFEGFVCAGCNAPYAEDQPDGCGNCEGPVFALYRSAGGVAYIRDS